MKAVTSCVTIVLFLCTWTAFAQEQYSYIVIELQETQEDGTLLDTRPLGGTMTLNADGSYVLKAQSRDTGSWTLEQAQGDQPARIMFDSDSGNDYFAYVQGRTILIWLMKTEQGTHLWARADLRGSVENQPMGTTAGELETKNGHFTRGVMYGGTNALAYQYQDQATGENLGSDSVGFLFSPNGTFVMRNQSGQQITSSTGTYLAENGSILCKFDAGGDDITFLIINGGTSIRWVNQGQTVAEYQFMGFSN